MERQKRIHVHVIQPLAEAAALKAILDSDLFHVHTWESLGDMFSWFDAGSGIHVILAREEALDSFRPEAAAQILGLKTIVLVRDKRSDAEKRWVKLGCMGVISENAAPSVLAASILAVAADEIWASRCALSSMVKELLTAGTSAGFTTRESEIVALLASGKNNVQMAAALCISRETVRWHLRGIYKKIGIHGRKQAAQALGHSVHTAPSDPWRGVGYIPPSQS